MNQPTKRKPWLAGLLSLFNSGLGQIYNGQLLKGLLFYVSAWLLLFLIRTSKTYFSFTGLIVSIVLLFCFALAVSLEAFWVAKKKKPVERRWFQRWYFYILLVLIEVLIVCPLIEPFALPQIDSYKIASKSMLPTLEKEDLIIVFKQKASIDTLHRGDVVVFSYPDDPDLPYIKRIVGLPGETIEIRDGLTYINNQLLDEPYLDKTDQKNSLPSINMTFQIAADQFFVMGDSRENSMDSRQLGPANLTDYVGKALYIYWSKDKKRIGDNVK